MKQAIWDLAQKLNYQPNAMASSLRKGKGNTIGVIIPRIDRYFFSSVIRGIEDVAYEAGYNVIISQSYDSKLREKEIVETLVNGKVDGLLVSISFETKTYEHFQSVKAGHSFDIL
jgi:LacI family transcriptional regulator